VTQGGGQQFRRLGKFELHEPLGEGAMGVVWKAYDSVLRRYVALKLLGSKIGRTQDMRERFLREARAAAALQHPNIITVYDLGEAEGQLFIAMELIEGNDLSELIASREAFALERKLDIVIEVLQGLSYAHDRGVIHRDVKPANVRIASDGRVKIMDFGIARLQSADITGSGAIMGTPTYMAPEQITNGPISPVTDVFAVGCMLYELLTYQKPFEGESIHGVLYQVLTSDPKPLRTMAPSIPASLERVVFKSMNKAPEDRYGSARELRSALNAIRAALSGAGETTTQRLVGRWTPIPAAILKLAQPTSLRARLLTLGALAVVVAVLAYSSIASPSRPAAPATRSSPPVSVGPPGPVILNSALASLRDSVYAAKNRAEAAGAVKNNVPSWPLAETMLQGADEAVTGGAQSRATQLYSGALDQYRRARREVDSLRVVALRLYDRGKRLVVAMPTGPRRTQVTAALTRADSLLQAMDYNLAALTAQSAEDILLAAGIAPPSPQPADPRKALETLLEDLGRAVATERISNMQALFALTIPDRDARGWRSLFQTARGLRARFTADHVNIARAEATADVQAVYTFVPAEGGSQRELRPKMTMRFTKTPNGWRIADMRETAR
jgi:serine/threonine protein kinase